ncbi:MAG TPA: S41 family peptidase, partial [Gemmatimonadaceae bacterium]|nr:S41 family peptidase [Gemmatimonadaceae bacterium]
MSKTPNLRLCNRFRAVSLAAVAAAALLLVSGSKAAAQGTPVVPLDTALELATFDSVWTRIQRTYYDSTMRGIDWPAVRNELRPRVARAQSRAEVRATISEMLSRLGESHFAVLPAAVLGDSLPSPAATDRAGDAGLEVRLLDERLLITRVDPAGPAAHAGVRAGWTIDRIGATDVGTLVEALRGVAGEPERRIAAIRLNLRFLSELGGPAGSRLTLAVRDDRDIAGEREIVRRDAPGQPVQIGALPTMLSRLEHERVALGNGCAGVIRFNMFMPPIAAPFDDAMTALRDCRGIVLDLRGNLGGVAAMVMGLSGYFFDEPVLLGELRLRGSDLRYTANPRRVSRHGVRTEPYTGPVAILVDELSASTTEIFAAALQHLSRARVFGVPSAGQALPA